MTWIIQPPLISRHAFEPEDEWLAMYDAEKTASHPTSLLCVTTKSNARSRRAVWKCAQFFRREFGYDFVQYGHEGREDDASARAYLWLGGVDGKTGDDVVVGACCFRLRTWEKLPKPIWALQWVWMHPYARNKGHLKDAWPYFCARFGEFDVEGPYSKAMCAFLSKHWVFPQLLIDSGIPAPDFLSSPTP